MEREEYEIMFRAENSHWWYQGMKAITRGILDRFVGRGSGVEILDAGCGTGAVMVYLSDYGQVTGVDVSAEALAFCRERGASKLVEASVLAMPFEDASFDLITSFDVLCACEREEGELGIRELWRLLRPGGRLLLRLPAYQFLRGKHDECVHTRHRFTRPEVVRMLTSAGFEIEVASYANTFLFPLALVKRMSERVLPPRQAGSDLTIRMGFANSIFKHILSAESPLIRNIRLPFGLTVVCLARKG